MCPSCRAFVPAGEKVCPYCEAELQPSSSRSPLVGSSLGQLAEGRFVTVILLTINFGMYLATALYSWKQGNPAAFLNIDGRTLFEFGAKFGQAIWVGQWWRLVTAGFLHGGMFHILMNSWVLLDLGSTVEQVYGSRRMVVIYMVSSVAGFLASSWWTPGISVGASAALFGLIGAMIAYGASHRSALGTAIRRLYVRWAIYGLIFGLLIPVIDNAAHVGGLLGGLITGYLAGTPEWSTRTREKAWQWAALGCVACTAWAFLRWWLWFLRSQG